MYHNKIVMISQKSQLLYNVIKRLTQHFFHEVVVVVVTFVVVVVIAVVVVVIAVVVVIFVVVVVVGFLFVFHFLELIKFFKFKVDVEN